MLEFYDLSFLLPAQNSGKKEARKKTGNLNTKIKITDKAILPNKESINKLSPAKLNAGLDSDSITLSSLPHAMQNLAVCGLLV
jgi:hypothetical protein